MVRDKDPENEKPEAVVLAEEFASRADCKNRGARKVFCESRNISPTVLYKGLKKIGFSFFKQRGGVRKNRIQEISLPTH